MNAFKPPVAIKSVASENGSTLVAATNKSDSLSNNRSGTTAADESDAMAANKYGSNTDNVHETNFSEVSGTFYAIPQSASQKPVEMTFEQIAPASVQVC